MMLHFPSFQLDVNNEQLWRESEVIPLRPKTFAVLRYLAEHAEGKAQSNNPSTLSFSRIGDGPNRVLSAATWLSCSSEAVRVGSSLLVFFTNAGKINMPCGD
jgi:hypothetical protein